MLQIESADVEQVTIACRSRFYIQVPHQLAGHEREDAIEQALINWKRDRAWQDIQYFIKVYARKLGVQLPLSSFQSKSEFGEPARKLG
jgi:hypothetical protein